MPALCALEGVSRGFGQGAHRLPVLRGLDLTVEPGDRVAVTGRSGAGKSTLLAILGLVDAAYEGTYRFQGDDVASVGEADRSRLRLRRIGIAFQDLHLVHALTAEGNVALPAIAAGADEEGARQRARDLLTSAGLSERTGHLPRQMSGGERRRVALARALANWPALLLLDEPTGELDAASVRGALALVERANAEGCAVVAVTHDDRIWSWCTRRLALVDGRLEAASGPLRHVADA